MQRNNTANDANSNAAVTILFSLSQNVFRKL